MVGAAIALCVAVLGHGEQFQGVVVTVHDELRP